MNLNANTIVSRIRDFTRMNHLTFFASNVEEHPQKFINEVFRVMDVMGVSSKKKEELFAYQLKYKAQV